MIYYAGIGSRRTPSEMEPIMKGVAELLRSKGYTLRSGGASGADLFFESGAGNQKEIYLPWKGFNGSDSNLYSKPTEEMMEMAEKYHPMWKDLSDGARKMMARNCCQVLGSDLKTPSDFIVCWTPGGKIAGGTGQALRMARNLKIPVFNLFDGDAMNRLRIHVNKVKLF